MERHEKNSLFNERSATMYANRTHVKKAEGPMNTTIKLIMAGIVCIHITSAHAKIQFRNRVSITAYKIDPTTHNDTWSIQTTNSPKRGTITETILSSSIVRSSMANLFLLKNCPTYVFVYKNDKASGDPIISTITPAQIKAVGSNPIIVINADGTATITARNMYEAIKNKQTMSYSAESNNRKSRR